MKCIKKEDTDYPKKLLEINNPPAQIYVEGNYELLAQECFAIVGTRKATQYGTKYAKEFAKQLSKEGICIISGMALGIDTAAHIGAMKKLGRTIAVLGSGFDYIYPEENLYLYHQILENEGCIISEYPPETQMNKANFPKRNRIISGLAMGVLVVEATYRSGAVITAKLARKQGKEIFCIPNRIDISTGYNTNELIKQGANLVTTPEDILQFYGMEEESNTMVNSGKEIQEKYQIIYKAIGQLPISCNEIAKFTNKSMAETMEALCMLELEGYIKNVPGNKYIRKDNNNV